LIDLIGVTWLATQHADIEAACPPGASLGQAAFRLKRAESALRRHLSAVKTLTALRTLMPQGLVPTQPLRLRDPDQKLG
jgi:hypothetical protein